MSDTVEQHVGGGRILDRINVFWALIYYVSLGLSLAGAWSDAGGQPAPWRLAAALGLCATSAALFHAVYRRTFQGRGSWPMQPRAAWGYFGSQLALLAALLALDVNFVALGFALFGQTCGALRARHWALVLAPITALLARALGPLADLTQIDWLGLASFLLLMSVWLVVALLIAQLFQQRYRLLALVEQLRQAKEQIEAGAAEREELAVLRERNRLAREMHDSLGHALVSVNVTLEAAERLYRVDAARGAAELAATRGLVRDTMAALRRSIADLRAPLAARDDLGAELRRLAAEARARAGLRVDVDLADEPPPPEVAETLLLIAREALANVERHARARRASIAIGRADNGWRLTVTDDGAGVRAEDLRRPGHFGVLGMRERADALHGTLEIDARPEGGSRVAAHIPDAARLQP